MVQRGRAVVPAFAEAGMSASSQGTPCVLEQAVVKAALDLFAHTSSAAFMFPIQNTTPPLFIAVGERDQIKELIRG